MYLWCGFCGSPRDLNRYDHLLVISTGMLLIPLEEVALTPMSRVNCEQHFIDLPVIEEYVSRKYNPMNNMSAGRSKTRGRDMGMREY